MARITHCAIVCAGTLMLGALASAPAFDAGQASGAKPLSIPGISVIERDGAGAPNGAGKPDSQSESSPGDTPQKSDKRKRGTDRPGCRYREHDLGLIV